MPDALIIPFVVAQAFPAPMITGSISQLFSRSRAGRATSLNLIKTPADPRHA